MSELSVRETAARAVDESPALGCGCCADPAEDTDFGVEPGWRQVALADAVLAAVADHDGLAGVLRAMLVDYGLSGDGELHSWRCSHPDRYGPCTCLDELTKDLADVIRAWLRGEA